MNGTPALVNTERQLRAGVAGRDDQQRFAREQADIQAVRQRELAGFPPSFCAPPVATA